MNTNPRRRKGRLRILLGPISCGQWDAREKYSRNGGGFSEENGPHRRIMMIHYNRIRCLALNYMATNPTTRKAKGRTSLGTFGYSCIMERIAILKLPPEFYSKLWRTPPPWVLL
jgi:hypothetical protein